MQFRPGVLLKMFRDARQQSLSLRWKMCIRDRSLGIVAACRHNGFVDNFTMVIAVLGIAVPNFVAAALLQYYVGLKLGWLPIGFWKSWSCSVLPSIALCFQPLATSARFIRAETLDVLQQDYIVTARSKGCLLYTSGLSDISMNILERASYPYRPFVRIALSTRSN